jgi:GDPmannose 4,6-dehydratase
MKRALICGIGGQDGAYLAKMLLEKGYKVYGTSRDVNHNEFNSLKQFGLFPSIELRSMCPSDSFGVADAVQWSSPDEIYYLAGQSSVGASFEMPRQTLESIVAGILNVLETVRLSAKNTRVFHASSSECFGDLHGVPATEDTAFRPCSPYGVAKCSAHFLVASYRQAYGLFVSNGILFNHESPLRPERFVTRKITAAAARISTGSSERLGLGNLDIFRDWGWAPDYVQAMWSILQAEAPEDFIIATGHSFSLEDFAQEAFSSVNLDWRDHVDINPSMGRPADLRWSGAIPERASRALEWRASVQMPEVARLMVAADLLNIKKS